MHAQVCVCVCGGACSDVRACSGVHTCLGARAWSACVSRCARVFRCACVFTCVVCACVGGVSVCARVHVCMCACACVRACVRAWVRGCVCVCVSGCLCLCWVLPKVRKCTCLSVGSHFWTTSPPLATSFVSCRLYFFRLTLCGCRWFLTYFWGLGTVSVLSSASGPKTSLNRLGAQWKSQS